MNRFFKRRRKPLIMSDDLQKRAANMLLHGATLLSEPCPYCKGVRVMNKGRALCAGCGSEPEPKDVPSTSDDDTLVSSIDGVLQQKIDLLSKELKSEKDHKRQQDILKTINLLLDTANRVKTA